MASIALCPRCSSHLLLPPDADAAALVECPVCEAEFSLTTSPPRALPQARIIQPAEPATDLETAGAHSDSFSRLMRASGDSPRGAAAAAPADGDHQESYDAAYHDADPQAETQSSPVEESKEELKLGSSRLDLLLSDLMKSPEESTVERTDVHESLARFEAQDELDETAADDSFNQTLDIDFDADPLEEEFVGAADFDESEIPTPLEPRIARRRKPPGILRTLVGIVGGGAIGILLGGYGLLWLRGPEGDLLGLAPWLPDSLLPSSAREMANGEGAERIQEIHTEGESARRDATGLAMGEDAAGELAEEAAAPRGWRADREGVPEAARLDPAVVPAAATARVPQKPVDEAPGAATAEPAPTMLWPTTPIVGDLRDTPFYSPRELDEALHTAEAARERFLASDLSPENQSQMGKAYIELCALAERFTLTDPAAFDNGVIDDQIMAKAIFRQIAGHADRRDDLALIAGRWLQHDRRQNQGVILVGRVGDLQARGKWTEYLVDVQIGEDHVPSAVLMDEIRFTAGDEVAIVGAIVAQPQERIAGYQGGASQVVVVGYAFNPNQVAESELEPGPAFDASDARSGAP